MRMGKVMKEVGQILGNQLRRNSIGLVMDQLVVMFQVIVASIIAVDFQVFPVVYALQMHSLVWVLMVMGGVPQSLAIMVGIVF